jgi:hypothetical protein
MLTKLPKAEQRGSGHSFAPMTVLVEDRYWDDHKRAQQRGITTWT